MVRGAIAWAGLAVLGGAALLGGGGCSVIIGDVPAFTCTGTDRASCPQGDGGPGSAQYCRAGACVPCEPRDTCDGFDNDCNGKVDDSNEREICDNIDNDCNGKVDDGPLSDRDGDGFTFCGAIDPGTGTPTRVDCNDEDEDIRPDATERCNGKDDDCDGAIDDGACPKGQTCAPKRQRCIDDAAMCTPQSCLAPRVCDPDTLECVTPNAAKAGDPCTSNRACDTGICGDPATLTKAVTDLVGNVCTKPCCTSGECPREQVCFGTGAGGRYCVPRTGVSIAIPLGTAAPGEACQNDGNCRSGACDTASKTCQDTCCNSGQCKNGTSCRLNPGFHGRPTFTCQVGAGTLDSGGNRDNACSTNAQCKSGLCATVFEDPFVTVRRCVAPCCGSPACPSISYAYFGGTVNAKLACRDSAVSAQGDVAAGCSVERLASGAGRLGQPCTQDTSCESELCQTSPDGQRRCTDVCCTDDDCASAGWVCRPTSVTNKLTLRCVPKP